MRLKPFLGDGRPLSVWGTSTSIRLFLKAGKWGMHKLWGLGRRLDTTSPTVTVMGPEGWKALRLPRGA